MNHCKKEGAHENKLITTPNYVDGISLGSSDNISEDNDINADVDDIIEGINKMGMDMSKCAACGKGGDNLKVCTACKSVKYCNAKCRNAHRSKHKKECKQLAAERKLQDTIWDMNKMEISDEMLFAEPPPKVDCPICMQPIPYAIGFCGVYTMYMECCGKELCEGCVKAADTEVKKGNMKDCCAFCRKPSSVDQEERSERLHLRMKLNDGGAFAWLGSAMSGGTQGLPQDKNKAIKLWNKAAELGSVRAHNSLGSAYEVGKGVEKDVSKAIHHYQIAAIGGHEYARYQVGIMEETNGNMDRAMKHWMIAARSGFDDALEEISIGYKVGHVTKEEYASTLRAHRASQDEMKSEQRSVAHALRILKMRAKSN